LANKINTNQQDSKFIKAFDKKHDIPLLDFTTFNSDAKTRKSNEYHVSSKSLELQIKQNSNSNLKSLDATKTKTSLTSTAKIIIYFL
jgi:hypothetical protein